VKKLLAMACFGVLLWAGTADAITWFVDSQMPVTLQVSSLGGGVYQYKVDLTYVDLASSDHSDMSVFILYPGVSNAIITNQRGAFNDINQLITKAVWLPYDGDNDPGPHGQHGVIEFGSFFVGQGIVWGNQGGFTFTSTEYNPGPMDFAYDTVDFHVAADHDWAVGSTLGSPIPLPSAVLLFGSGLAALLAARRRK
jgi:hypothetical protein